MYENGVFVPKIFVPGRHIFFVFDNCDFQEDTVDGKNTLHVTVTNIYQRVDEHDEAPNLAFSDQIEDCFIGNSGIDAAWLNADLYGQTTIKQIIDDNHMKRGVEAHTDSSLAIRYERGSILATKCRVLRGMHVWILKF